MKSVSPSPSFSLPWPSSSASRRRRRRSSATSPSSGSPSSNSRHHRRRSSSAGSPPSPGGQNQLLGTGIGGILGGVAGSFLGKDGAVGTVLGALVGAVVGNQLGALLDQREKEGLANASQRAAVAPAGEQVAWSTPDDKGKQTASGWAMPVGEPETSADGKGCRKVRQSADKGGKTTTEDVTLCREESAWVMPAP